MKLPYPCPKCEAPIMNYVGLCFACGHRPPAPPDPATTLAALRADLAAKSDALTIISKHDLVDFENPIKPGDAYRVLNNAILLARAALAEGRADG